MLVLFLYHRLYQTARRQLDALRSQDFDSLERLTAERDEVTRQLCERLAAVGEDLSNPELAPATRQRIQDLVTRTLDLDLEIKERLLAELQRRSLSIARGAAATEGRD